MHREMRLGNCRRAICVAVLMVSAALLSSCGGGGGAPSLNTQTTRTAPDAPSDVQTRKSRETATEMVRAVTSWDASPDADTYLVMRARAPSSRLAFATGGGNEVARIEHRPGYSRFGIVDVTDTANYVYGVIARNSAGSSEQAMSQEQPADATVTVAPPSDPSNLIANDFVGYVDLDWRPSSVALGYRIFRSDVQIGFSRTNSYRDDEGIAPCVYYTYEVDAYNEAGISDLSGKSEEIVLDTTLSLEIDTIAVNDVVNLEEIASGFDISGKLVNDGEGATVAVQFGENAISPVVATDNGRWLVVVPPAATYVEEGDFQIIARATKATCESEDVSRKVRVDLTAPKLAGTQSYTINGSAAASGDYAVAGATIAVSLGTSEAVQQPTVQIAGQSADVSGRETSWTATYVVAATVNTDDALFDVGVLVDTAGNRATIDAERSGIVIDTTAPSLVPAPRYWVDGGEVSGTAFAVEGEQISVVFTTDEDVVSKPEANIATLAMAVTGSGTVFTATFDVPHGLNVLNAEFDVGILTDIAGNTADPDPENSGINIDAVPPTVSYKEPASMRVGEPITDISPSTSDIDIVSYAERIDGTLPDGLRLDARTGVIAGTPTAASTASVSVDIDVTDNAGNEDEAVVSFPEVAKGFQTLTGFAYSLPTYVFGAAPRPEPIPPTSHIGNLTYASSTGSICSVDDDAGDLNILDDGTCVVVATASGDQNYLAASATASVVVEAASAPALQISQVAGDNRLNIAEKQSGFSVVGTIGPGGSGAQIEVKLGSTSAAAQARQDGSWTVAVAGPVGSVVGTSLEIQAFASKKGYAVASATRTVAVDLTEPMLAREPSFWVNGISVSGPTFARGGATISVSFSTLEPVTVDDVAFAGEVAQPSGGGTDWFATYIVPADANLTNAMLNIGNLTDVAGNTFDPPQTPSRINIDTDPPVFSYADPVQLQVGKLITPIRPTGAADIASYELQDGSALPMSLELDSASGEISGTPEMATSETSKATIVAQDRAGNAGLATITFPAVARGIQDLSGFAYSPTVAIFGQTAPTLIAPSSAAGSVVTYTSSTEEVCTVASGTGVLGILKAGTCIIVASATDTANYAAAAATVSVNVIVSLATPTGLAASLVGSGASKAVELSWTATASAEGYLVLRNGSEIGRPRANAYSDSNPSPGTHEYSVAAFASGITSSMSSSVAVTVGLDAPKAFNAVVVGSGPSSDIELSWNSSSGAEGYRLYRNGALTVSVQTVAYTDVDPGVTHFRYEAEAFFGSIVSERTPAVQVVVAPSAPTGLSVSATVSFGTAMVSLRWSETEGASSYVIFRDGRYLFQSDVTSATDTCEPITCAGFHTYKVAAYVSGPDPTSFASGREGARSAPAQLWIAPAVPTGLETALVRSGSANAIELTWNAPIGASGYEVSRGTTVIATTAVTGYTDEAAGTGTHEYRVVAFNDGGRSAESAPAHATLARFGLYAEAVGTGRQGDVRLTWDAAAGAENYRILRTSLTIGTTAGLAFVDTDPGVGIHSYEVVALNSSGDEITLTAAAEAGIAPDAPTQLRAMTLGTGPGADVTLSWAASAGAQRYFIYRNGLQLDSSSTTGFFDENPGTGTRSYQVAARIGNLESARSQELEVLVGIDAPSNLTAAAVGGGASGYVELSWRGAPGTDEFFVFRDGTYVGFTRSRATLVSYEDRCEDIETCAGQRRYSVAGFIPGSSGRFSGGYQTPHTEQATVWVAPDAPEGLEARIVLSGTASGIELAWEAATGATEYMISRDGISIGTSTSTSHADTDPGVGTFEYEVAALNDGGTSATSAVVLATVSQFNLFAEPVGSGAGGDVDLSWSGALGATSYRIYRSGTHIYTSSARAYTDEDPGVGVHSYVVAAYSGSTETRTDPVEAVIAPDTPVILSVRATGSGPTGDITLAWRPADGAASYRIFRDGEEIATTAALGYTDVDPGPGTYSYQVAAFSGMAESAKSAAAEAAVAPLAPTGFNAWVHGKGIGATVVMWWNATNGASRYRIYRDGAFAGRTSATSFTLTLLPENSLGGTAAGKSVLHVSAQGAGNNPAESERSATFIVWVAPDAPTGVVAQALGGGAQSDVALSWQHAEGATGYRIYRGDEAIGATADTGHVDMQPGIGMHMYRVAAINEGGESERSEAAEIEIEAFVLHAEVDGSGSTGDVGLTWNAVAGASSYSVLRNELVLETTSALGLTDADPGVGRHSYQVAALSGSTELARSLAAVALVSPDAPAGLTLTSTEMGSSSTIDLSWAGVSGADGYRVFRNGAEIGTSATTTFADRPGSGVHTYQVAAHEAGTDSAKTAPLSVVVRLDSPSRLDAEHIGSSGNGYIQFFWDLVPGAHSYVIYPFYKDRNEVNAAAGREYGAPRVEARWDCAGLEMETCAGLNRFVIVAVDEAFVVRSEPPLSRVSLWIAPSTPEGLAARAVRGRISLLVSAGSDAVAMTVDVALSWKAAAGATGYRIYRGGAEIGTVSADETSYLDEDPGTGTYEYQVAAYNDGGVSALTDAASVAVAQDILSVLHSYVSNSVVSLAWHALPGASSYRILRNGIEIGTTASVSFQDTNPPVGTHVYQVAGLDADGETGRTATAIAAVAPDAPAGLTAVAVGQGPASDVSLSWEAVAGADEYRIYRALRGSPAMAVGSAASTSYIDEDLGVAGYEYMVAAIGSGLISDGSAAVGVQVPPSAITGFAAESYGSGASAVVILRWDAPQGAGVYELIQDGRIIDSHVVLAGATLTNSALLNIVGRHSYQVKAAQHSEPAEAIELFVPPDAPKRAAAWLADGGSASPNVLLSWAPAAFADGYAIYRNGVLFGVSLDPYYDDTSTVQGEYSYAIETRYDGGASATRAIVNISVIATVLAAPERFFATAMGSGSSASVSLEWQPSAGASGYRIYREGVLIGSSTTTSFSDLLPVFGTNTYAVAAFDASSESARSLEAIAVISSPYGLTAAPDTIDVGQSVQLDWNAIQGAASYRVFRNGISLTLTRGTRAYVDSPRGGKFNFVIEAISASGTPVGPPSEQIEIAVMSVRPAAPRGLAAVPRDGDVDLTWQAATAVSSGGTPVYSYSIYRDNVLVGIALAASYTDEDPGVGGPYSYRVVAHNPVGSSPFSNTASASIADKLAAPSGLAASVEGRGTQADVVLEWDAVDGAAGFHVHRNGVAIATVSSSSYTDQGVASATHEYQVAAFSGSEVSDLSRKAAATVLPRPATPGGVAARAAGRGPTGDVDLTWEPVADAELYRILRNGAPAAVGTTQEANYIDSDPGEGRHTYQIVAVNSQGRASVPSTDRVALIASAASTIDPARNLAFVDLPAPNPSDGKDYRTAEYLNTRIEVELSDDETVTVTGLDAVKADKAYQRGYFGQGVTVGVVDGGFETDHPELTVNLLPNPLPLPEPDSHGSEVAGIIAAARDGRGVHGVAPLAKVVPYSFNAPLESFEHAVSIKIPIVNNSWSNITNVYGRLELAEATITISLDLPVGVELFDRHECLSCEERKTDLLEYKNAIENEDIVLVWSAGNNAFNSDPDFGMVEGCRLAEGSQPGIFRVLGDCDRYSTRDIVDGFTILPLTVSGGGRYFSSEIRLADLDFGLNVPLSPAIGPSLFPELLGRWVAVAGVTPDKRMFFNGCGKAMHYCMSAPAFARGLDGDAIAGTSFSAPYVSGALAVLKSRFPDMPMYAILAILFHTAEDLGEPGTDEVFGRGFLDLDAATSVQGSVAIVLDPPDGAPARSARLAESAIRVPPALGGLALQAEGISVAVSFLDGHYYNTPLSGLFEEPDSWRPSLGWVAREMLAVPLAADLGAGFAAEADRQTGELRSATHEGPFWRFDYERCRDCASSSWREYRSSRIAAPFFAAGGEAAVGELDLGSGWSAFGAVGISGRLEDPEGMRYRQLGLRWKLAPSGKDTWGGLFELSRSDEDEALLGGDYSGALAVGDAQTYQARLQGELNLGEDWTAAGGYTAGWVRADAQAGSMIEQIGGIRFAGWRAYLEGRSLLTTSDSLRIGLTRQIAVEDGFMRIRHGVVDGEATFSEEHYMNLHGGYGLAESTVRLGREGALGVQLGYAFSPRPGLRAALGLEHAGGGTHADDYAGSLEVRWDL